MKYKECVDCYWNIPFPKDHCILNTKCPRDKFKK